LIDFIGAAVCTETERIFNGATERGSGLAVDASERKRGEANNTSERRIG